MSFIVTFSYMYISYHDYYIHTSPLPLVFPLSSFLFLFPNSPPSVFMCLFLNLNFVHEKKHIILFAFLSVGYLA
jgi:hypothetical protein